MKPEHFQILQLFSHPVRVQMMGLLGQRPWTADEMKDKLKTSRNIVNAQIQNLRNVKLLHTEREGLQAYHWLDKERLTEALAAFAQSAGLRVPNRLCAPPKTRSKKKKPAKKKPAKRKPAKRKRRSR